MDEVVQPSVEEQPEQDDDRDRDAKHPKYNRTKHLSPLRPLFEVQTLLFDMGSLLCPCLATLLSAAAGEDSCRGKHRIGMSGNSHLAPCLNDLSL